MSKKAHIATKIKRRLPTWTFGKPLVSVVKILRIIHKLNKWSANCLQLGMVLTSSPNVLAHTGAMTAKALTKSFVCQKEFIMNKSIKIHLPLLILWCRDLRAINSIQMELWSMMSFRLWEGTGIDYYYNDEAGDRLENFYYNLLSWIV